jgi:hypothetical protein
LRDGSAVSVVGGAEDDDEEDDVDDREEVVGPGPKSICELEENNGKSKFMLFILSRSETEEGKDKGTEEEEEAVEERMCCEMGNEEFNSFS